MRAVIAGFGLAVRRRFPLRLRALDDIERAAAAEWVARSLRLRRGGVPAPDFEPLSVRVSRAPRVLGDLGARRRA